MASKVTVACVNDIAGLKEKIAFPSPFPFLNIFLFLLLLLEQDSLCSGRCRYIQYSPSQSTYRLLERIICCKERTTPLHVRSVHCDCTYIVTFVRFPLNLVQEICWRVGTKPRLVHVRSCGTIVSLP